MTETRTNQVLGRKPSRRRSGLWRCSGFIVLCVAAVWFGVRLMSLDLLSKCYRAADADAALPDSWEPQYRWVTDTTMLSVPYRGELERAYLLDTARHVRTPLFGLQKHLALDKPGEAAWELSPDRSWIAWSVEGSKFVRVARLDGTELQSVRKSRAENYVDYVAWKNNTIVIETECDHRTGDPLSGFTFGIDGREPRRDLPIQEVRSLVEHWSYSSANGPLHGPAGAKITLSSVGNSHHRMAALTTSTHERPFARWIGRFWPDYAAPVTYAGLWVSPVDHEGWRQIGAVAVGRSANAPPSDLRWLPSDKRVSFMFQGAIWTAPVD